MGVWHVRCSPLIDVAARRTPPPPPRLQKTRGRGRGKVRPERPLAVALVAALSVGRGKR